MELLTHSQDEGPNLGVLQNVQYNYAVRTLDRTCTYVIGRTNVARTLIVSFSAERRSECGMCPVTLHSS